MLKADKQHERNRKINAHDVTTDSACDAVNVADNNHNHWAFRQSCSRIDHTMVDNYNISADSASDDTLKAVSEATGNDSDGTPVRAVDIVGQICKHLHFFAQIQYSMITEA